jgi:tetratricopeptide (TPR) repeat protein
VAQLRSALEHLEAGDPRRPEALANLAGALNARAEYTQAAAAFESAAAAYRDRGDELAAANLAFVHAMALRNAGEDARSAAVIEAARPVLEANPGPGMVDFHLEDSFRAARGADYRRAIVATGAALELAEQLGLPRPYRALTSQGIAKISLADPGGESDFREGIELAVAAGDNRHALASLASRAGLLDDVNDGLAAFNEASAFAARYGLADDNARAHRLDVLQVIGHWDEALEDVPKLLAGAVRRGDGYTTLMSRMVRADIEVARGELSEPVDDLMELASTVGFRPWVPSVTVVQAAFQRGDREQARAKMLEAVGLLAPGERITGVVGHVATALDMGDVGLARQVIANARPGTIEGGPAHLTDLANALVLEAEGDAAGALVRFDACHAFAESHGWVEMDGDSLAGLGRCRIALGEVDAGLALLQRAREIALYLKARGMLTKIDAAIGAAG